MMQSKFTRIGNWAKAGILTKNLTNDIIEARLICLRRWALKAEAIAKKHLTSQDLANGFWRPLAAYTIQKKSRLGHSLDTLIETSTYLQSITSWVQTDTAYAGVKRTATYKTKNKIKQVADVARLQEMGSLATNLPARPLWQPTYFETMQWHLAHNNMRTIFLNIVRKKYG